MDALRRILIGGAAVAIAGVLAMGSFSALAGDAGPGGEGGDTTCNGDEWPADAQEFSGVVVSVSSSGFALRTDGDVFIFWYTADTAFEDVNGDPASQEEVATGVEAFVVAVPSGGFFDALLVRIGGEGDGGGDTDCGDDTGGDNGGDGTDGDGTDGGGTDGDGTDGDGDNTHDGEPEGSHRVAQAIADTFGVPVAEVLALHENGAGFGAIFKLYWLAAAGDTTVEALMADADGNGGFAFGKLFKEMDDEVSAFSAQHDDMPKNLGQAVSGGEKKDMDSLETDEADGHGPPDHAKAHGRR